MKKRNINLDLIRACAVWCVLSVHFFLNNGFYEQIVCGQRMYLMILMRTAFMVCVPLFLLLTGFLMGNKKISWQYYLGEGIVRIIFIYFISSISYVFVSKYVFEAEVSMKENILNILGVKSVGYGWYVEMYVGLYLLIPFLNILYKGLNTKREKQCLIIVLLLCTTLPSAFSAVGLNIASWWINLYPITYYYIGAYIKEYDVSFSTGKNILILGICVVLFSSFNYYTSYGSFFKCTSYNDWYGFENIIDSVLLFLLLLHMKTEGLPGCLKKGISKISELSFGIYLLSCISDKFVYPVLNGHVADMPKRLIWYPVIVSISFLIAMFLSYLVQVIYKLSVYKLYLSIRNNHFSRFKVEGRKRN